MKKIKPNFSKFKNPDPLIKYISPILDAQGFLVVCPKFDTPDFLKIIHNFILEGLYKRRISWYPVHTAWNMPHVNNQKVKEMSPEVIDFVNFLFDLGVFENDCSR